MSCFVLIFVCLVLGGGGGGVCFGRGVAPFLVLFLFWFFCCCLLLFSFPAVIRFQLNSRNTVVDKATGSNKD